MSLKPSQNYMRSLAIIPARGGSKRIPRKNIRDFLGKPIIAYCIETALQSNLFDVVMVSTDDSEIADIAATNGASVPFLRSPENSDDAATTLAVIQEVLQHYADQNQFFDAVCCIYPTAVLTTVSHLEKGLALLQTSNYDSVFPVVPYGHPIWRGFKMEGDRAVMLWPEYQHTRTQDLPSTYHDAGQWYWLLPNQIKDRIFTSRSGTICLSEAETQDIDNEEDWQLALLKYTLRKQ